MGLRNFRARDRLQEPRPAPRGHRRVPARRFPLTGASTEPMRRRLLAPLVVLAGLVPAAAAHADVGTFIPAEPIDGPNAEVKALGDLDVARDGTGALTYVRTVGGVDHVFIARSDGGAWQAPEGLDGGLPGPSSQPVVAAGDGGSLVIAFISAGTLYTIVKPGSSQPYTAPQPIAANAINPSIDLSINDVAYVTFTVTTAGGGGDVGVARKDRRSTAFNVIPAPLDIDPARGAGIEGGRSKVAVAADGVAIVVWGEAGRVFARRVFERTLSVAPQDATVDAAVGHGGGPADVPDVDVQDDSSFAWVVFREVFDDGHTHAIGRRLLGSQFDPPAFADGQGIPGVDSVGPPRVDVNGRGDGYIGSAMSSTAMGAVIKDRAFTPGVPLGLGFGGAAGAAPVPAVDENGDGLIAWINADQTVHARAYTAVRTSRTPQAPQPDRPLSNLGIGGADAANGLEAAADRAGDVAVAFTQGALGSRAIVVASFDRAPGSFRLSSGTTFRNVQRTPLRWTSSFELWGPLTYTLEVDGQVVGRTNQTTLPVPGLADGVHRWRVIATDRRGQVTATPARPLRQDATPPRARVTVSGARRRGRPVRVTVRPTDANPAGRPASGIGRVQIAWGDGSRTSARRATHRYGRGRFTIRVTVRDRAGNAVVVRRSITVR